MAKARKQEPLKLYPINIREVIGLLNTLKKKEEDKELKESIECLKWIFSNIYGNVLVCKVSEGDLSHVPPCCGMC